MLDLDEHLQPNDSPVQKFNDGSIPWKLGVMQNIQQNRLRMSQANIKNFVFNSTLTSGTFALGSAVTVSLTTNLTHNIPRQNDPSFSLPHMALYEGTSAIGTAQIFPGIGAGIATGAYACYGGYNYQGFDGTATRYTATIANNTGIAKTIYYAIYHKFILYNSGTAS